MAQVDHCAPRLLLALESAEKVLTPPAVWYQANGGMFGWMVEFMGRQVKV